MPRYPKLGITGANGTIGRILLKGLSETYSIRSFTRRPVDFDSTIVNLQNPEEIKGIFENLDAVVHLAADPSPLAPWESIWEHNFEATYQVFEECRRSGVQRIVFASTNHTQHGNTILTTPETLDKSQTKQMKLTDPPNPDSYYAISKLFGENLGKLYSERHNLEFVGLRIGWIIASNDPTTKQGTSAEDYMRAMFLSHRDCIEAHRRALEINTRYLLAYVISNNDNRVFDLEETTRTLGFKPQDDANTYFKSL